MKLADVMHELGALVRSRAADYCFTRAGAARKQRPAKTITQGSSKDPPMITLSGHMPPWNVQE